MRYDRITLLGATPEIAARELVQIVGVCVIVYFYLFLIMKYSKVPMI